MSYERPFFDRRENIDLMQERVEKSMYIPAPEKPLLVNYMVCLWLEHHRECCQEEGTPPAKAMQQLGAFRLLTPLLRRAMIEDHEVAQARREHFQTLGHKLDRGSPHYFRRCDQALDAQIHSETGKKVLVELREKDDWPQIGGRPTAPGLLKHRSNGAGFLPH